MIKLKDLLPEKFASKAQQGYMFATNPEAAKKLASKMTKQDYKDLPDKVDEIELDDKESKEFLNSISAVKKLWEVATKIDPSLLA